MEAGCDERDPRIAFGCRTAAVEQPVDNIKRKDKVFLRALGLAFLNYTVGGDARRNKPFFHYGSLGAALAFAHSAAHDYEQIRVLLIAIKCAVKAVAQHDGRQVSAYARTENDQNIRLLRLGSRF